jgi:Cys-tRNA(Pro)/Cys-tRNA(Cys) deacylase
MTPALDLLKKVRAEHRIHNYEHDPKAASYGLEAAEKLGLDPAQVFKTLLASSEKGELLVAVVPVVGSLDLKALAHAAGVKKSKWLIRRRRNVPPVTCWEVSAHWGRRSVCAHLST